MDLCFHIWFISSASTGGFFVLGLEPRASASFKVEVRGCPRVSGRNMVRIPMMKARIPTMSYRIRESRSYCSTVQSRKCIFMLYHASVLDHTWPQGQARAFDCGYIPEADRSRCQRGKHRKEPPHFPPDTSYYHCLQPETCRTRYGVCY